MFGQAQEWCITIATSILWSTFQVKIHGNAPLGASATVLHAVTSLASWLSWSLHVLLASLHPDVSWHDLVNDLATFELSYIVTIFKKSY